MSFMVPLLLFGWILVVLVLFAWLKPRQAVVVSFLVAWLFLTILGARLLIMLYVFNKPRSAQAKSKGFGEFSEFELAKTSRNMRSSNGGLRIDTID